MKIKRHSAKYPTRKNPAFYQYGYHFTNRMELDSIFLTGLIKTLDPIRSFELIYKIKPIYFLTYDKIKFLSDAMKNYIQGKDLFLKVNVSQYNQYPDFGTLRDFGFEYWKDHIKFNNLLQPPKLMKKWIIKYDNKIAASEFFKNPYLIKDAIATTHSFVILENIPVNKIISIFEIPVDKWGDKMTEIIE